MIDPYELRRIKIQNYLHGRGLEIGAGLNPQKLPDGCEVLYFDKRTSSDLVDYFGQSVNYQIFSLDDFSEHFPNGADFLIAHHVLEHTPDPIGTLREWHKYLRPGGVFAVSVPYHLLCLDFDRLKPDIDHLLLDHFFERGEDSFESREHVLSFLSSWTDEPNLTTHDFCKRILSESKRSGHDFHWHAFDHQLFLDTIYAAAILDNLIPVFYELTTKDEDVIDILYVYTLQPAVIDNLPKQTEYLLANINGLMSKLAEKTHNISNFY